MNAAEVKQRRTRALANPIYFGEVYVRPYDENWSKTLPRFAAEMMAFALKTRRGVVILPPEFLKTTLLSQVLPLWLTYRWTWMGKTLRGMLLSEEEGMATNNLSVIAWHIENNEYLARDFCDAHGHPLVFPDPEEQTWREDAIIVKRAGTSKDPTWQAKGIDSKGIQGRRLDWLIGDDVITPKNAFSPAMRRAALNLWELEITTRLVREGQALIAGNFNHQRDLVSTLASRKSYGVFRRPALHKEGDPSVGDENGVPLWPDNWPKERLAQEKEDKPQRFRRIFLLDARAEEGERLKTEWMQVISPKDTVFDDARFYISLDPAPGGTGDDLDFFNVTILAVHGAFADIVVCHDARKSVPEQIDLVAQLHDRFARIGNGVMCIAGARQAMDRYMRGAIVAVRPDLAPKIVDVSIPGQKEERLEALGPYARSGWLRCWDTAWYELTSDREDQYQELTLIEQWRDFPHGKHDDKLDGVDVAVRAAREFVHAADMNVALTAA